MTNAKLLLECIFENAEMYYQCDDKGEYDFTQMGWSASDAMDLYEHKTTAEGLAIVDRLLDGKISYDEAVSMASDIDETPEEAKAGKLVYDLNYLWGPYYECGYVVQRNDGSYFAWKTSERPQDRAERCISAEEYDEWKEYMQDKYEGQSEYDFNSIFDFNRLVENEFR
ncbi:hypothetical protein ACFORG_20415 [Lutimaribacter marinistellae]|uniref:Uncharacterized protein n=1 Tax=Lutimaribacter marinistellae TaxID=1820329 RepID=A0ABV7TMB7_9RHOB